MFAFFSTQIGVTMRRRTEQIADGIYWVGGSQQEGGLNCNPYLIVDGEEAVLIDPGSVLDFDYVFENVCNLVPLDRIKYVILHHQDPDFCSSVPLFEKSGAKFTIITHWRTQTLVKFYGIISPYYIINEHNYELILSSGRSLEFVMTPYLHFPGAFVTYDKKTKVLFSSDLFGAFSFEWELYAGDDYIEKMKAFHEHYMPGNSILRPVMETLLGMDIEMIASQHGSVIREQIAKHIKVLRDLECGTLLNPIKRNLAKSGGYMNLCSLVLKRFSAVFSKEEVLHAISGLDVVIDSELNITDYNYNGNSLWNLLFEQILDKEGIGWIIIIEPFVHILSKEYDVAMPELFEGKVKKAESEAATISEQNKILVEINKRLEGALHESENKLIRCPNTGLYNQEFFKTYLLSELHTISDQDSSQNPALILIRIDEIEKIEFYHGNDEVDGILKNIADILDEIKEKTGILFKLDGANFAYYSPHDTKEKTLDLCEFVRNKIAFSEKFIEKVTASIGVVWLDEIRNNDIYSDNPYKAFYNVANMRVRLAENKGGNLVCSKSTNEDYQEDVGKILLVDTDMVSIDILKTHLENMNYKVVIARDGEEALKIAKQTPLLLILSEIMLPKKDGFLLREELLMNSNTKNIPFIFLSYLKNNASVLRAFSLDIDHYYKKPYMLSELIGVIKNKVKGENSL